MTTQHTTIEWTDRTWNPITGCTKISPGCDGCYAETIAHRFAGSKAFPNGFDVTQHAARLSQPLRWRKPARVFVNSMSDLFHADVPDEFIARVFAVMALTPQHTYQILTKRHARMRSLIGGPCKCGHQPGEHLRSAMAWAVSKANPDRIPGVPDNAEQLVYGRGIWPLPNVWLGVSVENQRWADIRIPALLETPAAVRFLSCEPLLGPIDLTPWLRPAPGCGHVSAEDGTCTHPDAFTPECHRWADCPVRKRHEDWHGLDWVIVGGESGPKARAMHPDWARYIRTDCETAGVPFFFKQWGEWGPAPFIVRVCDPDVGWKGTDEELAAAKADSEARGATHVHTGNWLEEDGERRYHLHEIGHKPWSLERVGLPEGTAAIRRWGKKRAGRELDGQVHDAFPA
jgi:protein gp37